MRANLDTTEAFGYDTIYCLDYMMETTGTMGLTKRPHNWIAASGVLVPADPLGRRAEGVEQVLACWIVAAVLLADQVGQYVVTCLLRAPFEPTQTGLVFD